MLRRSSDVQSSLGKSSALFSARVEMALDVGSGMSPSASAKKVSKARKESGPKGAKKRTEGPSSSNNSKNVSLV